MNSLVTWVTSTRSNPGFPILPWPTTTAGRFSFILSCLSGPATLFGGDDPSKAADSGCFQGRKPLITFTPNHLFPHILQRLAKNGAPMRFWQLQGLKE